MKCVGQAKVPWLSKERPRSSMRSIPLRLIDSVEVELEITRMKVNKRDRRNCQEPRCSFAYFLTTRETAWSFD